MPRDSNGNYTLPTGNPVVGGTPILADGWANPTLNDIGLELTNSLDRNGRGGMLVPFKFVDGTEAAPAMSFTSEPGSGLYKEGNGDLRMSVLSTAQTRWNAAGFSDRRALDGGGFDFFRVASGKHFSAEDELGNVVLATAAATQILFDGTPYLTANAGVLTLEATNITFNSNLVSVAAASGDANFEMLNLQGGFRFNLSGADGDVAIQQTNAGGSVQKDWVRLDRDGTVTVLHNGLPALLTTAEGAQTRDTSGNDPKFELRGSTGTLLTHLQHNDNVNLVLKSFEEGLIVALAGTKTGGASASILVGDPDGKLEGRHAGVTAWETTGSGLDVESPGGVGTNGIIGLSDGDGGRMYIRKRADNEDVEFRNQSHGGSFIWQVENPTGAVFNAMEIEGNTTNPFMIARFGTNESFRAISDGLRAGIGATYVELRSNEIEFNRAGRNYISVNGPGGGDLRVRDYDDNADVFIIDPDGSISGSHKKNIAFVTLDEDIGNSRFGVRDNTNISRPAGFNVSPVRTQNANYVFANDDIGYTLLKNSGGAVTYTCNNVAALLAGARWDVVNDDAEDLTIAQGTGVTVKYFDGSGAAVTGNHLVPGGGVVTVMKYTNTEYWVFGQTA